MAIVSFSPDTLIDYIPVYGGNRDSDDPCIIRIKFVPYSKVQVYARMIAARNKGMMDVGKMTEATQDIQKKQFIENVESISGYSNGSKAITTAEEFYDCADTELIMEIIRAMESSTRLSEGQKKI